jgi:uncharacterized membrane protein
MAPLVVMVIGWIAARLAGGMGWPPAESWSGALRVALAGMFIFTAASHFHPRTRRDLVRMVPDSFPSASALVSATGVLEVLGAIGLLTPVTTSAAAYALAALLVALFPANVHAARRGLAVAGRKATPLVWRLPLQVFWIACLLWVGASGS